MRKPILAPILAPLLLLTALTARAGADEQAFGMRVGGYGFRAAEGDAVGRWDDCRMNGVGVFGQRYFGAARFLEAGLDLYFAQPAPLGTELEMDRLSTLATVAGGLRMFPGARVSPYVQVGAGLEITRVTLLHGAGAGQDGTFALPLAFVGAGGDVGVNDRLRLGMTARFDLMGNFDDEPDAVEVAPEAAVAAQVQFYAAYRM